MMRFSSLLLVLFSFATSASAQEVVIAPPTIVDHTSPPNSFIVALAVLSQRTGVKLPETIVVFDHDASGVMVGVEAILDNEGKVVAWSAFVPQSVAYSSDESLVWMWTAHLLCLKATGVPDSIPMRYEFYGVQKCTYERLGDDLFASFMHEYGKWEHFNYYAAQTPFADVFRMEKDDIIRLARAIFQDKRPL